MPDTDWTAVSGQTPCVDFDRAMRRFSSASGIPFDDLLVLHPDDAADLLRLWSTANRIAEMERTLTSLTSEIATELTPVPERFTRRSTIVATVLMSLTALAFLILCTGIWRFFS